MTNMARLGQKENQPTFQFDRYLPHTITGPSQASTWHHEKSRTYCSGTAEEHAACWLPEVAFKPASSTREDACIVGILMLCEGSAGHMSWTRHLQLHDSSGRQHFSTHWRRQTCCLEQPMSFSFSRQARCWLVRAGAAPVDSRT